MPRNTGVGGRTLLEVQWTWVWSFDQRAAFLFILCSLPTNQSSVSRVLPWLQHREVGQSTRCSGFGTGPGLGAVQVRGQPLQNPTDLLTAVWLPATAPPLFPPYLPVGKARYSWLHCTLPRPASILSGSTGLGEPHSLKRAQAWQDCCSPNGRGMKAACSLIFTNTRFSLLSWAVHGGLRHKLPVPLWHFKIYPYYFWFSITGRHRSCFIMEVIAFSASVPAKSFSERSHSHSRDLTGLPVSAAVSVAAVTFYYRFRKSPQCSTHCEITQETLSLFFLKKVFSILFLCKP